MPHSLAGGRLAAELESPAHMPRLELDDIQASAARFLIDGGALDAARILLACELGTEFGPDVDPGPRFVVVLAGPRAAYDELLRTEISGPVALDEPIDEYAPTYNAVRAAIEAVIPPPYEVIDLAIRAQLQPASEGWRDEMIRALDTRNLANQGPPEHKALTWETLRFRSASEIRIAAALDRAGVLFFPSHAGELPRGRPGRRGNPTS